MDPWKLRGQPSGHGSAWLAWRLMPPALRLVLPQPCRGQAYSGPSQGHRHSLSELDPGWRRNIAAFLYAKARGMHVVEAVCDAVGATVSAAQYWSAMVAGFPAVAGLDP